MAEQILLSLEDLKGFHRTGTDGRRTWGISLNLTFLGNLVAEEGEGTEELVTRISLGLPPGGGTAGVTLVSLKTGFRRSTETTSYLEPIWRRKYLSCLSSTR